MFSQYGKIFPLCRNFQTSDAIMSRETIGINGSLNESPLAKSMPPCYQPRLLGSSEPRSRDWALEFQNGGPRVKEREFPCLILRPGLDIPLWGEDFTVGSDNTLL